MVKLATQRLELDEQDQGSVPNTKTMKLPTFAPILPPIVTDIAHEELVAWKKKRRDYEDRVSAHCAYLGEDVKDVIVSVKNSFDRGMLDVCCRLHWDTTTEAITEEELVEKLDAIIASVKNDTLPDIDRLFERELKIDLHVSDVPSRILRYFKRCDDIISEHGLTSISTGDRGIINKCNILVRRLEPRELKDEIDNYQRYQGDATKQTESALYKVILAKAIEQDKIHHNGYRKVKRSDRLDDRSAGSHANKTSEQPSGVRHTRHLDSRNNQHAKLNSKPSDGKFGSHDERNEGQPWKKSKYGPPDCLHCHKPHLVANCPIADEATKERLLLQHREKLRERKKNQSSNARYRSKRMAAATDASSTSPMHTLVGGVLKLPYCADSGSDWNVMSRCHLKSLQELDPAVKPFVLEQPVVSRAMGGTMIETRDAIDVHLTLQTAAGPVRCQDKKRCLIVDTDEDEFIVGKGLLGDLGIDVERQLEQLAVRGLEDDDPVEMPATPETRINEADVSEVPDAMMKRGLHRGLPHHGAERLREVMRKRDLFRVVLGNDPPAKVAPLRLRLKANARPYKCKARKYSPEKSKFLEEFNDELVQLGWVYENKESRWACPAVPIQKANCSEFRQTSDYRPVNDMTETIVGVMPNLHVALEHCKGKKFYALFDFLKGFWQLPLAKCSREILSYMTDKKVFTPTRVPQGCADAALHFQAIIEGVLGDLLYKNVIVWIDDLLVYADTEEALTDAIERLFTVLDEHGLKLSAKKCEVFLKEVRWCGRMINEHGVSHDPAKVETLRAIPYPATAAELQQFVCASNWMRESLVDYARTVNLLQLKLDSAMKGIGKTKKAAAGIQIELSPAEKECFDQVKELLSNSATLTYPEDSSDVCIFTDASDFGWGLVATHVTAWNFSEAVERQRHQLLMCMGGTFRGSELNWSVIEKEAYPIIHACDHLEYLLLRPRGFRVYCDHRNIIHMFAPDKELKKHVRGKLQRWSTKLLGYRYTLEHIEGVKNVWADLVSRWGGKAGAIYSMKRLSTRKQSRETRGSEVNDAEQRVSSPLTPRPLQAEGFVWPSLSEIQTSQREHGPPNANSTTRDGVIYVNERIWVPTQAPDLLLRLMVVAHCGSQGHRGVHVMRNLLQRVFYVDKLSDQVQAFCRQCLLCLHVKGGKVIPRPWSETYRTYERNVALHWDFLSLGESFGSSQYVLVLKDEASHFTELVTCDRPTSEVAAMAMLDWHSRFGMPSVWISDSGAHFKNRVIQELSRRLKSRQVFVLAYCPWKNGTVERVNRDIVQVLKALILEYKINRKDWPYLIPIVQASLNHSPVESLANKAPIEVFTGMMCPSVLDTIFVPEWDERVISGDLAKPSVKSRVEALRRSIEEMHKDVKAQREKRTRYRQAQNAHKPAEFCVGDFVLRSRVDEKKHPHKLTVTWVGPYRVTQAVEYYFVVEDLVTKKELNVHPSRLKFYADESLNVTEELLEHVAAQDTMMPVEGVIQHKFNMEIGAYEVLVRWKGLEEIEDSWEPLSTIAEDVPQLLLEYASSVRDAPFKEALMKHCDSTRS